MSSKGSENEVEKSITAKYYHVERRIGKGAYGVVWKAYRKVNREPVALKKIYDAFKNREDAQRTYREVVYLKAFKGHPNIIQLLNVHKSSNNKDLYLVFEYMDIDLHKYLSEGYKLRDNEIRYIMYQLLKALKYIHSGNIVHRDLKPSNILLNSDCVCKLADFGMSRSLNENCRPDPGGRLTEYVATRWYRAPEILMGAKSYTKVVDIWSLGCVLGEMVTGGPLFPGNSTLNQLELIGKTLRHSREEMKSALESYLGCEVRLSLRSSQKWSLKERLSSASTECIDMATRMLELNPFKRFTASDALRHPYVFRYRRQEPVLSRPVIAHYSDSTQLSVQHYRSALYGYDKSQCYRQYIQTQPFRRQLKPNKPSTDPESNTRRIHTLETRKAVQLGQIALCRGSSQSKFR